MAAPPVGLAVLGAGRIGAVHIRNAASLAPKARLVAVADLDRAAARRAAAEAGVAATDPASALADPAVQAVVIATPTPTHAELIAQAAAAGKHILCEKPISPSLAQTRTAMQAAARTGVILQVGYQRRFDAEFARARSAVAAGELGKIRFVRLVGRDHRVPSLEYLRGSGGQFKDQMVHEFDLARWLLAPDRIEEVYATGSALVDAAIAGFDDVDTSLVVLRFASGAMGAIDDSREAIYGYDVRGELHGSGGLMLVGQQRLHNGSVLGAAAATPDVDSFIERFAQAYRAELEDFVEAIVDKRAPRVGGNDDLEAMRLAIAADRSFRLRRPVRLAEVADA